MDSMISSVDSSVHDQLAMLARTGPPLHIPVLHPRQSHAVHHGWAMAVGALR